MFIKYVGIISLIFLGFTFIWMNFATPPALSHQIDMKTMSPVKLHTYIDNYTSDYWPSGSSWWRSSYGWK